MSYFPEPDPAKLRAAAAQNYTIYGSSASSSRRHRAAHNATPQWSVPCSSSTGPYPSSQSMPWSCDEPRGLGLLAIPVSNNGLYGGNSTVTTSGMTEPSLTWTANAEMMSPDAVIARKDSAIGHCHPLSTLLPTDSMWSTIPSSDASMLSVSETSPSRSEYSNSSSHQSIGSSPYTQAGRSYPSAQSPSIKMEDSSETASAGFPYVPTSMALDRPMLINAEGFACTTGMSSNVESTRGYLATSSRGRSKAGYTADDYAAGHQSQQRSRASSYISQTTSADSSFDEQRPQKRSFTTVANSTCACDQCGKLFQRSYNLKAHMETHDPNREQPHECQYTNCRRRFVRRTDLARHERSVHLKIRNYSCPLCEASFSRKDTQQRHVDDGCPRRTEVRRRVSKPGNRRAGSASRMSSSPAYRRSTGANPPYSTENPYAGLY